MKNSYNRNDAFFKNFNKNKNKNKKGNCNNSNSEFSRILNDIIESEK